MNDFALLVVVVVCWGIGLALVGAVVLDLLQGPGKADDRGGQDMEGKK